MRFAVIRVARAEISVLDHARIESQGIDLVAGLLGAADTDYVSDALAQCPVSEPTLVAGRRGGGGDERLGLLLRLGQGIVAAAAHSSGRLRAYSEGARYR
jgi:hypothetical protein